MEFNHFTKLNTISQGDGKLTSQMERSLVSEEVSMVKAKEKPSKMKRSRTHLSSSLQHQGHPHKISS